MSNDAIDQSWGYADPAQAAAAGIRVVSMYLSHDPSKNATSGKIAAYHAHGIGVLLNWEDQPGAPLAGAAKGSGDGSAAVQLARELKAPAGTCIYFSCDTDINPGQFAIIDSYYRAARNVVHAAGYLIGCYGEADLVQHLSAAGITDAQWQTLAWSNGRLDPAADFYQTSINGHLGGASVDFDRIIHPAQLGAWWPANSPYAQEDDVSQADVIAALKSADGQAAIFSAVRSLFVADDGHQYRVETLIRMAQDPAALAAAIAKQLPAGSVTAAQIETAVRAAIDGATIQTGG